MNRKSRMHPRKRSRTRGIERFRGKEPADVMNITDEIAREARLKIEQREQRIHYFCLKRAARADERGTLFVLCLCFLVPSFSISILRANASERAVSSPAGESVRFVSYFMSRAI